MGEQVEQPFLRKLCEGAIVGDVRRAGGVRFRMQRGGMTAGRLADQQTEGNRLLVIQPSTPSPYAMFA